MSQKLKSAAAFALACSGPAVAWGATLPGEANFTGPLVTPAVNALPAGMVNIQPYLIHTNTRGTYDNRGGRHESKPTVRQWQMALPITYALTDTASAQVILNAARTSGYGQHSDGMRVGDTTVRFQQRLRGPDADGTGLVLGLALAQRLPTGRYHRLDTNPLNGTGNGAMRTTFAFGAQELFWLDNGQAIRWRGQLAWSPSPGRIRVRDSSVYGTDAGFRGHARLGQAWNASVAAEYALDARVMLKKGKGEQRIAKIFDRYSIQTFILCWLCVSCNMLFWPVSSKNRTFTLSFVHLFDFPSPLMPEEDATFQITNGGIDDVA